MPPQARLLLLAIALAVGAACSDDGDGGATDPTSTDSTATDPGPTDSRPPATDPPATDPVDTVDPDAVLPEGFTTVTVQITGVDGEVCEVCMWLADDGGERGRGLMGVTDLGEPVGMAFVFPQAAEGAFYMFGTPTPLSIAWFGTDGGFVSSTDMEPCRSAAADCERYFPAGPYQLAIEVFEGGLGELGIGPGSSATVLAGTEAAECHTVASS